MMEPKIRLKGFSGEWEKVTADSIFRTTNERNYPELPVLSATQDKGMVTRESIGYNIFHDKSNETSYKHILPGQFVTHLRSFQGGFAHSSIEGIYSPAYTILDFKEKETQNDIYWKYVLTSRSFIKSLELITYGIRDGRSISYEEFKNMHFLVPSLPEQRRIASFFTALDRQITAQSSKISKLKQIKSACLDQMFV
jgi:type I restriction enzyme, S subunit